ncbi:MAG: NTP transferase domain-containing protein [Phascolarctobacterium sp.]|nr:NTP transferase domain-containing protein [Phascolarctobacterium sp.]
MIKYNAVILAGGKAPWLRNITNTDMPVFAEIGGKKVIDRLLDALAVGRINRVMLAGAKYTGVEHCPAGVDLPETAALATEALGDEDYILFVSGDLPLLTDCAVNDFLAQCEKDRQQSKLYYPVIPRDAVLSRYPDAQRTYGTVTDGVFTGGNVMLLDPVVIPPGLKKAKEIFALRKSPFALCTWLGWSFIFKVIFHRLSTEDIEKRVTGILGFPCRTIISDFAEIGMDMDKSSDFYIAEKYLTGEK